MKRLHIISVLCFVLGLFFLIISGLQGDLRIGVVLIFPFIIDSGPYALGGFVFLILAFFLFFLGFSPRTPVTGPTTSSQENGEQEPAIKGGGIVLVGPIPIIMGSSWKITLALILTAIVLILLVFFLFYFSL